MYMYIQIRHQLTFNSILHWDELTLKPNSEPHTAISKQSREDNDVFWFPVTFDSSSSSIYVGVSHLLPAWIYTITLQPAACAAG